MAPFATAVAMMFFFRPTSSAPDCAATGSCKTEADVTSLLQVKEIVKHGFERMPDEDEKDALVRSLGNKTGVRSRGPPAFHGFFGSTGSNIPTCFLSKKSLFTSAIGADGNRQKMAPGCQSTAELGAVDAGNTYGAACQACLAKMKAGLPDAFMVDGKVPAECSVCARDWVKKCVPPPPSPDWDWKTDSDRVFQAQQQFMLDLASQLLMAHSVALYLDFDDDESNALVEAFGGRTVAFDKPEFYAKMLNLLKIRTSETNSFIHWVGASGDFCLAEQAGNPSPKVLRSPPIGYMHPGTNPNPICSTDGASPPLLEQICGLCGGQNCAGACSRPLQLCADACPLPLPPPSVSIAFIDDQYDDD